MRAIHAAGRDGQGAAPAPAAAQRAPRAPSTKPRAQRPPARTPDEPPAPGMPPGLAPPTATEMEPLTDALAILVMSTGDGELAVHQAAYQLTKRRGIDAKEALAIVRRARMWLRNTGETRKALDPVTQAVLIGETRARFLVLARMAMDPANFTKGGGAVALKCMERIALLDGCPVDGMVQIVGHISHDHDHAHRVIDPERAAIAAAILERVKRTRVIDVAVDA